MGRRPRRTPLRRRRVLASALTLAALGGLGLARARSQRRSAVAERALRPPGALAEDRFAAACVRCGLCVQACPFGTLRLASDDGPVAAGTPYFVPREVPCAMCNDVPCQRVCPTGALGA